MAKDFLSCGSGNSLWTALTLEYFSALSTLLKIKRTVKNPSKILKYEYRKARWKCHKIFKT
jgi:hypothetical protein